LTYNNISRSGLDRLSGERYEVGSQIDNPDAILLRSFNLHDRRFPNPLRPSVVQEPGSIIFRRGIYKRGIPVFNAPAPIQMQWQNWAMQEWLLPRVTFLLR